ncbi:hypothetical protein KQI84_08915 [bacterium]|nr:hypothetical protein [bacterium]
MNPTVYRTKNTAAGEYLLRLLERDRYMIAAGTVFHMQAGMWANSVAQFEKSLAEDGRSIALQQQDLAREWITVHGPGRTRDQARKNLAFATMYNEARCQVVESLSVDGDFRFPVTFRLVENSYLCEDDEDRERFGEWADQPYFTLDVYARFYDAKAAGAGEVEEFLRLSELTPELALFENEAGGDPAFHLVTLDEAFDKYIGPTLHVPSFEELDRR